MSSLLSVELAATCNALGKYDPRTKKYLVDGFTLGTVKDLVRFLRRDGEDHEIRRHLGQTKVLQTDLVPLLIDHWEDNELFDATLRLLVNLTNPALLLYREEVPTERSERHNYLQILSHLQTYKAEAFKNIQFWEVITKKLMQILEIDWQERDEDTGLIIERILILIRNILHVPSDDNDYTGHQSDTSVHDQVLWALNKSNVLDIILYMSSENEKQYFMHILEIISHLLREQNPTSLADSDLHRSVDEKLRDEQELLSIRMGEMKQRNDKIKQFSASRHSRFGGTYVMQNMKSVSDNDVICFKPLNKISNLDFGGKKDKLKRPKNRRPVESDNQERRSAFAIRLVLKEFCLNFLNGSYNPLMHYVRDVLVRAKAQQSDESYYLWVLKFFMEFNRGHNFQVGLVSETMSVELFHYVQQLMEKYFDMIRVDKKKGPLWVKRLHLALRAYKEMLNTLLAMDKSSDSSVRESAKVLMSNIFYVLEYREFVVSTFLKYDDAKMPRSYLIDLVETTHLFLKMLEHFCKKTGLVVQKRLRKKGKNKKKSVGGAQARQGTQGAQGAAAPAAPHWEEVRAQVAAVLSMSEVPHVPPFDAASDTPIDTQRAECIQKIQKCMMESKYEEAIGLLRAAREVWPEEGIFGVSGIPEEEELSMLETIYVADLGVELTENVPELEENLENNEEEEEEEEEEEGPSTTISESEFDFADFAIRFCNPCVTSACAYLLERFDKNQPHTNHCAVKLLHRVAWDCALPAMTYQASLFATFQRVLARREPQYKELEKFAVFILRKFTEAASAEPKVFLELLFWKKLADAREIQNGYNKYDHSGGNVKPGNWSEEQEDELRQLYMENQTNPQTDQDVIDWILENLIDQTRTRRVVIKKLKELGLIFRAPTKKSNAKGTKERVPVEFTEEEDEALRSLWERYSSTTEPMVAIVNRMPLKRTRRRLVERLLQLGIVQHKKECSKKKSGKGSKSKGSNEESGSGSAEDSSSSSESDSDGGARRQAARPLQSKPAKGKGQKRVVSGAEIARVLIEAVDKEMSEALSWLAECLEEVALDQEAEGYDPDAEGVPLVPISGASVLAMESELFQRVLTSVGVEPPSSEQESYWRIPSVLTFETLRKRREVILKAVDKSLSVDDAASAEPPISQTAETNQRDVSSDDDDVFNNLRKITEANPLPGNSTINKKRSRSVSSDEGRRSKIHKIVEVESADERSDEDILSFAKKNLPIEEMPNTEDLFNNLLQNSDAETTTLPAAANTVRTEIQSSDEDIEIGKKIKRKRQVIDDDSD